jgi:hypothetical protein
MLLLRKRPPTVGPGAFPDPPPRAWGPRRFRRKYRSRAEGGTGRRHKDPSPQGASRRGLRSRAGRHHRVGPHAEVITHGGSGIPWAKKWPRLGILRECRNSDIATKIDMRRTGPSACKPPLAKGALARRAPDGWVGVSSPSDPWSSRATKRAPYRPERSPTAHIIGARLTNCGARPPGLR